MDLLLITDSGCEEACRRELVSWGIEALDVSLNCVAIRCDPKEARTLVYHLQVPRRILLKLTEPFCDEPADPVEIRLQGSFRVEPEVLRFTLEGEALPEQDKESLIGTAAVWIKERFGLSVDLDDADHLIRIVRTPERTYIGLDLFGASLAKREWRVMLSRRSLKSTIAAAAAIYSGLTREQEILDPMGDDGTLVIESALLLSRTSPRIHSERLPIDSLFPGDLPETAQEIKPITALTGTLREMKAILMNSKLAGIDAFVDARRVPIDWMETKIPENSVDALITSSPQSGRALSEKKAAKILDDLFFQAEFALKQGGKATFVTSKPEEIYAPAKKYKLKPLKEYPVLMGKQLLKIVVMEK